MDPRSPSGKSQMQRTEQLVGKFSAKIRQLPLSPKNDLVKKEIVLLTGASGSLGSILLDILCKSERVAKIYALVRGPSIAKRMKGAFEIRGLDWGLVESSGKVEVLEYNMTETLLGLDNETYDRLSLEVTSVIHNAWKLDWVADIDDFENYLEGTVHMIRFCVTGRKKVFNFTSSVATLSHQKSTPGTEIDETPLTPDLTVCYKMGYARSKHIIEQVSQVASNELSLSIRILRLGQISGDSKSGYWNTQEILPYFIKCSVYLRAFPVQMPHQDCIDFIPCDVAAQTIHDIITTGSTDPYIVYNIVNRSTIPWRQLVPMLKNLKVFSNNIQEVSFEAWIERAKKRFGVDGKSPLFSILDAVDPGTYQAARFKTDRATEASETFRKCPEYQECWLELSVKAWRSQGFLPRTSLGSSTGSVRSLWGGSSLF